MRILLIEDDGGRQRLAQAEGEGHSVDWAARLDEAFDALATTVTT